MQSGSVVFAKPLKWVFFTNGWPYSQDASAICIANPWWWARQWSPVKCAIAGVSGRSCSGGLFLPFCLITVPVFCMAEHWAAQQSQLSIFPHKKHTQTQTHTVEQSRVQFIYTTSCSHLSKVGIINTAAHLRRGRHRIESVLHSLIHSKKGTNCAYLNIDIRPHTQGQ